jgi:hypothetical protein
VTSDVCAEAWLEARARRPRDSRQDAGATVAPGIGYQRSLWDQTAFASDDCVFVATLGRNVCLRLGDPSYCSGGAWRRMVLRRAFALHQDDIWLGDR